MEPQVQCLQEDTGEPNNFLSRGSQGIIFTKMLFMVPMHIFHIWSSNTAMVILLVFMLIQHRNHSLN